MHPLQNALIKVGEYVATTTPQPPLFEYAAEFDKKLNRDLVSDSLFVPKPYNASPVTPAPLYILNIPFTPSRDQTKADAKWNKLVRIIRDESFGNNAAASQAVVSQRLLAIIGVNRSTSIDRDDDIQFKEWTRRINVTNLGFNYRVLSTLWKALFVMPGPLYVDHQISQIAFIVLEYLSSEIANKTKSHLASSSLLRQQIPFTHVREWIKNDMLKLPNLEARLKHQPVYMVTMDDDPQNFRLYHQGLFSEYDQIVSSKAQLPQVMSTGYYAPATANSSTKLAVDTDMYIREGVSLITSDAVYFPEPNTCFLLNDSKIRERLSFITKPLTLDTEGRRIFSNIRPVLDKSRVFFVFKRCLATEIPTRMEASQIMPNYSLKNLGQLRHLKSLKGISQTHADLSILSNNIWLSLKEPKPEMFTFKTTMSGFFQCFDPIALAQTLPRGTNTYNYKCLDFLLTVYPSYVESLHSNQDDAWAESALAIANIVWPGKDMTKESYKDALVGLKEKLSKQYEEAKKKLGDQQAQQVFNLAKTAAVRIFDALRTVVVRA